jgi:hypothetical protein
MTHTYVWQGPCLLTPITVEALLVGQPNRSATWAALQVAYQNVPLGGDPSPAPFQTLPQTNAPGTGAHLMAILPNGLRHAVTSDSGTTFQPVPNRWLVMRFVSTAGKPPALRAWVLQSDFTGAGGTNPWPGPTLDTPTTLIGKSYDIAAWTDPGGPPAPILRASAPGSLSWLASYANIGNVMALYDPLTDVTSGSVSYAMLGWYQPASFDPLLGVTQQDPQGFTDQATWAALMQSLSCIIPGSNAGLTAAQNAWTAWLHVHPNIDPGGLPAAQQALAAQNVCHGFVYGLPWQGPTPAYPRAAILSNSGTISMAVGGTGIEAIAAWMAQILGNPKAEDLLLALGEDLVFTYGSDPAAFAQESLTRRYGKTTGETQWLVALVEGQQPGTGDVLQSIPLTQDQTAALTALNAAQVALDAATRTFATVLWELFALVWKYTVDGVSYRYQTLIQLCVTRLQGLQQTQQRQSTARDTALSNLRTLLGAGYTISSVPAPRFMQGEAPTLLIAGAASSSAYQSQPSDTDLPCRFTGQTLTGLEVVDPANKLPNLTEITAAQMLAAVSVPVGNALPKEYPDLVGEWMLLDTGNGQWMATLLYANAGVTNYTAQDLVGLTKTVQTLQTLPTNSRISGPLSPVSLGDVAGFVGTMPPGLCALPYSPAWVPLFIDWQTNWSPSAGSAAGMLTDWTLSGYSYSWQGTGVSPTAQTYTGRTLLNTAVASQFAASLENFVNSAGLSVLPSYQASLLQQAAACMPQYDIITQALSGQDGYFITRASAITGLSYSGGDPSFNAVVNGYLAQTESLAPVPGTLSQPPGFYPLRSGHIAIQQLWVVDGFGQVLVPSQAQPILPIRSESVMTPPTPGSDNLPYVQLAPQIASSTRLNLVMLDAVDDTVASNSSDATSPVAGWLLPNHLDNSLQVFDSAGNVLGEVLPVINDHGEGLRWDPAPGQSLPLGAPPAIPNAHVASFLNALMATQLTSGSQALTDLLDVIDTSLWATAPRGQPVNIATAALVGCPLAIVRASVALQSFGDLPYDQAWADTPSNNDGGLSQVPIPTWVGDLTLDSNGVLAFFLNDDYSLLRPARGYHDDGTQSVAALRRELRQGRDLRALIESSRSVSAPAPSGYIASDPSFPLLATGTASLLTVIMDPRGWLTTLNGLLPVVTLGLPPGPIAQAMANLNATFRIGPILWDQQSPDLPLPAIGSAVWSWIARTDVSVWETQPNLPTTQPQTLVPPHTLSLREGWLALSNFLAASGGVGTQSARPVRHVRLRPVRH